MNRSDPEQRIIFRPAAVQRYVQGVSDDEPAVSMASPRVGWCYALMAVCIGGAMAALWGLLS